jgi:hypothetical protein
MNRILPHFKRQKPGTFELSRAFAISTSGVSVSRIYGNLFPVPSHAFELDNAVNQGEQRIILAASHVIARMDLCPVLSVDDVSGPDRLTAEFFAAQPLAVRIATVSG